LGGTAAEALALAGIENVSRETLDRLAAFITLLAKWQARTNLVAGSTLGEVWRRHVADSAQLVGLFPDARAWLDLGSGAGFPGLVIAILETECGGTVYLVESDSKKAAFLRRAILTTAAPAVVLQGRIEAVIPAWKGPLDIVTARALAPLDRLLELVSPLVADGARAAFPKGRGYRREIDQAAKSWDFDLVKHKSKVEDDAVILEITRLRAR
jgi:16S rRNA (guanine527-N7)-methyltransferase